MKKNIVLIMILISFQAFSQLFVGNTATIFVKNEVVSVAQDLNLQTGSNFYLRNESQLVQRTTSTSANVGGGQFSVFQEGNSNNFAYNYWCSPVGNASATVGNENFGITMLSRPTTCTASTPALIISNDSDGVANPLSISDYWIYKYLSSSSFSAWIQVGGASTIAAGEGFTMKGTAGIDTTVVEGNGIQDNQGSAQRYDFHGKPNDGNISVSVAPNNFTLTGNPYPSALNVNAFLLDVANTASTAVAYYWEQDKSVNSHNLAAYKGGYGSYSPVSLISSGIYVPATFNSYNANGSINTAGSSSGISIQRKYAPIGQGFFIQGAASGTSVTLKNAHRTYYKESTLSNSYFSRNNKNQKDSFVSNEIVPSEPVSLIRLNILINNEFTRQIALGLIPEATDGVERGIEAAINDQFPNDGYFFIENGKYVIQGIAFDINKRIQLGLNVTGTTPFTFSLLETVNFDQLQPIYIYDALEGSYHNIRNSNYEISLSEGIYNNRFEITFTDTQLNVNVAAHRHLTILQKNSAKKLIIDNRENLNLLSMLMYDISGKMVMKNSDLGTSQVFEYDTSIFSDGIYFVKVTTDDKQVFTQKIIVKS